MPIHRSCDTILDRLEHGESPAPFYMLVGDVGVLAGQAERLMEAVKAGFQSCDVEILRDDEATGGRIEEAVTTPSLFSQAKIVKVVSPQGPCFSRGAKAGRRELPGWVRRHPGASSCVVILVTQAVDRGSAVFKTIDQDGEIVEPLAAGGSAKEQEAAASALVREWCSAQGLEVEAMAVKELLGMVGHGDLGALRQEVDKLVSAAKGRGARRIVQADVASVCVSSREEAVYVLTDRVGARDLPGSVKALARLIEQGIPPLALLQTLAAFLRRLLMAKALLDSAGVEGIGSFQSFKARVAPAMSQAAGGEIPGPLKGMKPYGLFKVCQAALRFRLEELVTGVASLADVDLQLKGGHPDPSLALEAFVMRLAGGRSNG